MGFLKRFLDPKDRGGGRESQAPEPPIDLAPAVPQTAASADAYVPGGPTRPTPISPEAAQSRADRGIDTPLVTFHENGDAEYRVENVAQAKLALKQLRLRKRELAAAKRTVGETQRQLRAQYTEKARRWGPAMRGGGTIGKFARAGQATLRAAERNQLAKNLAPHEEARANIEARIRVIDSLILKLDTYLLENTP